MMDLETWIKTNEGLKLKAYRDSQNLLTIGYGRCLDRDGITQIEAQFLFEHDLANATRGASAALGISAWLNLDQVRKCALVDMAFNLGEYGLADFHKMLAAIRAGDWNAAEAELLDSDYAKQTPNRAHRNALLLLTGAWPAS